METEKAHRSTSSSNSNSISSSTSELFVCFTSRLSSSSMKLSSKSILSPSRNRDPPQISLSSSLSRRLRSNGSIKGGQASPMFPTGGGKRRGCGFENPEPSSPKVTCIGQVRVKTKKQGKKMRSRSKRRGEASFRRGGDNPDLLTRQNSQSFQYQNNNHQSLQQECLKHRNQRWVHLPLTICEALREFSCFFPCRSSCMSSSEREKEEKGERGGGGSGGGHGREGSCGAAFARWLVALQDGDGKGRGIELVMEHHEEEMGMEMEEEDDDDGREKGERSHSQRRHIFEDLDIDVVEGKKEQGELLGGGEEEEKGRVSICIPPKNALLLMRCRSDPVKMAALANRFWESPLHKDENQDHEEEEHEEEDSGDDDEEEEEQEDDDEVDKDQQHIEMEQAEEEPQLVAESETQQEDSTCERETEQAFLVVEKVEEPDMKESCEIESRKNQEFHEEAMEDEGGGSGNGNGVHQVETFSCVLLGEAHADLEKPETEETHYGEGEDKNSKEKEDDESAELSSSPETFVASEQENEEAEEAAITAEGSTEEEGEKGTCAEEKEEAPTHQGSDPNANHPESTDRENESKEEERGEALPECLLLMMCEPKLSMEVSKETWVCSTDFIRWLPERPAGGGGEKRVTIDSSSTISKQKPKPKPHKPLMQPPRSSCSFPASGAGMSMATMIEQKLVGSSKSHNGYEPFVLTRCKSEPMRTAAKLAPEACCWNNRKLEPHPPPAPLGVGAPAGVGF